MRVLRDLGGMLVGIRRPIRGYVWNFWMDLGFFKEYLVRNVQSVNGLGKWGITGLRNERLHHSTLREF